MLGFYWSERDVIYSMLGTPEKDTFIKTSTLSVRHFGVHPKQQYDTKIIYNRYLIYFYLDMRQFQKSLIIFYTTTIKMCFNKFQNIRYVICRKTTPLKQ